MGSRRDIVSFVYNFFYINNDRCTRVDVNGRNYDLDAKNLKVLTCVRTLASRKYVQSLVCCCYCCCEYFLFLQEFTCTSVYARIQYSEYTIYRRDVLVICRILISRTMYHRYGLAVINTQWTYYVCRLIFRRKHRLKISMRLFLCCAFCRSLL